MGSWFSNSSSERKDDGHSTPVSLNVYDLTPLNDYTYWLGLGIFHSGVEVDGLEYAFGAHDFPSSGIFEVEPKTCPQFIYRCSIPLGCTDLSPTEFRRFMEIISSEYHGDTYHLIYKNCNHFSADVCERLTRRKMPGWVNRLAGIGSLCSCLLPDYLQLSTVKQAPEYLVCSEVSDTQSTGTPTESDGEQQERYLLSDRRHSGELTFIHSV